MLLSIGVVDASESFGELNRGSLVFGVDIALTFRIGMVFFVTVRPSVSALNCM